MIVHGNGSIVPREDRPRSRCRSWMLQVVVEEDGKRRRKSRAFHGTYTQAQAALADFVSHLRGTVEASDMPFADWCDEWHRRRVASMALSPVTVDGDAQRMAAAKMHLTCSVGEVTPEMVRSLYASLMAGDSPSGRPWKPKSVEGVHKALVGIFSEAVKSSVIGKSPMDAVQCPKVPKKRYTVVSSPQMDELLGMLDYSDGTQRAIALCCACGLRRREAAELMWSDFGDSAVVVDAKTASGRRSVPVPDCVRDRMEPYRSDGAVSGGVRPDALTRWWTRNRRRLGCCCTLHDLRRSYATRLAEAGVHPRVMMELMGHSSIDVCMEIYTQVSDSVRVDAVRAAFRATSVQPESGHEKSRPDESAV